MVVCGAADIPIPLSRKVFYAEEIGAASHDPGLAEVITNAFAPTTTETDLVLPHAHDVPLEDGVSEDPLPSDESGWDDAHEDDQGLYVSGRVFDFTPQGRLVQSLIRAGVLDGLSIGFRTAKSRPDGTRRLRVLTEVELWEVSLVTFPMLAGARLIPRRHDRAA